MTQTKLRTYEIKSNKNITFPIGTVVTVQRYSQKLNFERIFGKHKKRGRVNRVEKGILGLFHEGSLKG